MSFYHKYRPQKFDDLFGQDHVKKTITSAIRDGKTGHAYLFSGPRGVGKTTVARLLAKALNCEKSSDTYEPCNSCLSCREIALDKSLDVIEIDAASNRGIDEIRELREKIRFAPNRSKYKVYIIDEVHMLTKEAFNALLKTLEEPPKHAIFIMATTELHKIPATILSRVQSFNFKRADIESIIKYIQVIIDKEKIKIDGNAVRLIAIAGDGSYRDATSVLDQVASIGKDNISLVDVQEILGIAEEKTVEDFIDYLFAGQKELALELVDKVFSEGYDLENFCQKTIDHLRKIMIIKANPSYLNRAELTNEQKDKLLDLSQKIDKNKTFKIINIFIEEAIYLKGANIPQLPLELAVMEVAEIIGEKNDESNSKDTICHNTNTAVQEPVKITEIKIEKPKDIALRQNKNIDAIFVKKNWPDVLKKIEPENRSLYLILRECEPREVRGEKIVFAVRFKLYQERISAKKNYKMLAEAMESILGKNHELDFIVDENIGACNEAKKEPAEDIKNVDGVDSKNSETKKPNNLVSDALEIFEI